MNPFAKEFQPSGFVFAKPIRTKPALDIQSSPSTNNSLNHPNVGPGQQCFDLPENLWPGPSGRPAGLPAAPSSSDMTASETGEGTSDDLELDEASVLEHLESVQAQPAVEVSLPLADTAEVATETATATDTATTTAAAETAAAVTELAAPCTPPRAQVEQGTLLGQTPESFEGKVEDNFERCNMAVADSLGSPLRDAPVTQVTGDGTDPSAAEPSSSERVGPDDFELLRVVGQGAFGKVFQVRMKSTGMIYAMKVMRKEKILEKDHGEYIKSERDVLTSVLHPYIVTLRYSFQTSSKLYLVLDFINGGHLFFQLYRAGIFDEQLARLYTAEIVLAISHLHSLNFVHRDLKPENVLLDSEGHIKVTDFGLAKGNMDAEGRTNSFIGTMEYMAPEIIAGQGHGKAVDWWSTGILLYEMLCGMPPFRAKGRAQLQKQITSGKLKLPPYLSAESQALLKALLTRDVNKRLGSGPNGSADIQKHPFFHSISWSRLMQNQVASPFKPTCRHEHSVENFDKIWTDQAPEDSPCASPTRLPSNMESAFEGFTYVAPSFLSSLGTPPSVLPRAAGTV